MFFCRLADIVLLIIVISVLTLWRFNEHAQSLSYVHKLRVLNQSISSLEVKMASTVSLIRNNTLRTHLRYPLVKKIPVVQPSIHTSLTTSSSKPAKQRKALIFTMDSLTSFEQESLRGGAAGEMTIRRSLEEALTELEVKVDTVRSDAEFNARSLIDYDIVILDPWTWAGPGWVLKRNLIGVPLHRIYVLDFFGHPNRREMEGKVDVPYKNFLTAFGSPWKNTFLGYFLPESILSVSAPRKLNQGVIWGKDHKHLTSHLSLISHLADKVHLIATTTPLLDHPQITWLGHVDKQKWWNLLLESKFLIGLGDPLLGPSAIDAISAGCTFINPIYKQLKLGGYPSQNSFAQNISPDRVCSYPLGDASKALECVNIALGRSFDVFIPPELSREAYIKRVRDIFGLD